MAPDAQRTRNGKNIGELELLKFTRSRAERPDHVTSMTSFPIPHAIFDKDEDSSVLKMQPEQKHHLSVP